MYLFTYLLTWTSCVQQYGLTDRPGKVYVWEIWEKPNILGYYIWWHIFITIIISYTFFIHPR